MTVATLPAATVVLTSTPLQRHRRVTGVDGRPFHIRCLCMMWHLSAPLDESIMHTTTLSSAQCRAAARRAPQLRVRTRRGASSSAAAGTRARSVVVLAAAVRHTARCMVAARSSIVLRLTTVRGVAVNT